MLDLHRILSSVNFTFLIENMCSLTNNLNSGLQGSVNVHHGALLMVPQWQCISSFVFYILKIVPSEYKSWLQQPLDLSSLTNWAGQQPIHAMSIDIFDMIL